MKPFLGIDLTYNDENEVFNGEEFIVQRPSKALQDAQKRSFDQAMEALDKAKLPLILRLAKWISGLGSLGGFMLAISVILEEEDVTFQSAWQAAPWLFILFAVLALIFVILYFLGNQKYKAVMESEEQRQNDFVADQVAEAIQRELGVPCDAKEAELL